MAWNSVLTKAGAVDAPPTARSIGKPYNRSVNHMMRSLVCLLSVSQFKPHEVRDFILFLLIPDTLHHVGKVVGCCLLFYAFIKYF